MRLIKYKGKPFGLNHAYGSIVRKGKKGRAYAQRFLLPDAKKYKKQWTALFQLHDVWDPIPKFHKLEESDKPYLALCLTLVYNVKDFEYSTGRVKGIDVTNAPKLIEDALCEYIGLDDSRTVSAELRKTRSNEDTHIILAFGFTDKPEEIQFMSDMKDTDLPAIIPFAYLKKDVKKKVDQLLKKNCVTQAALDSMRLCLQEFGDSSGMVWTAVNMMVQKGFMVAGSWEDLIELISAEGQEAVEHPPETEESHIPARVKIPESNEDNRRGTLPFKRLPKAKETAEEFLDRFEAKAAKRKPYAKDMLLEDGSFNEECKKVYDLTPGRPSFAVYKALVNTPTDWETLKYRLEDIPEKEIAKVLKKFIVEPSWLPPGAGRYCEDETDGTMKIERSAEDVALTRTYMRS
jgi:hypothetical protein